MDLMWTSSCQHALHLCLIGLHLASKQLSALNSSIHGKNAACRPLSNLAGPRRKIDSGWSLGMAKVCSEPYGNHLCRDLQSGLPVHDNSTQDGVATGDAVHHGCQGQAPQLHNSLLRASNCLVNGRHRRSGQEQKHDILHVCMWKLAQHFYVSSCVEFLRPGVLAMQ